MRSIRLLPLLVIAGCATHAAPSAAPPPAAPARASDAPRPFVVSIVIDQMAAWIAAERWPTLPKAGGFARLAREGTYAREVRYAHAATDTAPGHASLYTGATPHESGIVANESVDEATGARVSILRDARTTLVTAEGARDGSPASSIAPLVVDTVADRLRASDPGALNVSLSLKDRGAIFGGGRRPTASVWFEPKIDAFVTSTAFAAKLPSWATPPPRPATWDLLDAAWVRAHAATPDAQDGEGDVGGLGTTFPHALAASTTPGHAFRTTPHADDALLAMALAAIDAEAASAHPALVAISLSANDYVGHTFGPDSWEAWDELLRLDAALARFFSALDARFGAAGWSVVLSADHGVTTMPEATRVAAARPWCTASGADRWQRACGEVERILPDALAGELRAASVEAIGPGAWIAGVADPYVHLTAAGRALDAPRAAKLYDALTRTLLRHRGIERVIDMRAVPDTCPPDRDESNDALVCHAFKRGAHATGALYMLPRAGSFFDPSVVVGKGTSHGSPHLFDRSVPLLVRAPGRAVAARVVDAPVSFRSFARTLSSLLGVDPPAAAAAADDLAKP
jgi:hypothetical protein